MTKTVTSTAQWIAHEMQHLAPGDLAPLRRMKTVDLSPAFWWFQSRAQDVMQCEEKWMPIVSAIALLTPRGDMANRKPLHDPARKLGTCLCDGGNPGWGEGQSPRPLLSEARIARLSNARGAGRIDALFRAVRMLAGSRDPGAGVDVGDLAWAFLKPDPISLNRAYYAKLHSVSRPTST